MRSQGLALLEGGVREPGSGLHRIETDKAPVYPTGGGGTIPGYPTVGRMLQAILVAASVSLCAATAGLRPVLPKFDFDGPPLTVGSFNISNRSVGSGVRVGRA